MQEYENLIQEKEELKRKRQLQITDNEDKLKLILEENKELIKQIELKTDLLESQEETIANLNLEMVTMNAKIAKLTKTKGQRSKSKLQTEDKGKDSADSDSSLGGDDENEEDDSGKQSSTQTSSNTLTINTPVKQIKYNEKQADKMDLETLTTLYIKLVSYKKPKQTQEATKFKLKMIEKSKKMDQEINAMKTRLTQLQNELASLQEKYQQNVSADKVNEQVVELLKSKQKLEKEIKNLRDLTDKQLQEKLDLNSIINDIGNREVKLNEELINAQDEIKEKNKLIIDYQKTVTELEEKLSNLPTNSSEVHLSNKLDQLSEKLQESATLINKLLIQNQILLNRSEAQTNEIMQTEELPTKPQYSKILMDQTKNISTISESAILIKRRKNTKISMAYLRNLLHSETKELLNLPKLICTNTRDKDVLLIKSDSDEGIDKLLNILDGLESLKEIAEITYKSENRKRIIILGVPVVMEPQEIVDKIKQDLQHNQEVEIVKILKRDKAHTFQIILEINQKIANLLFNRGRLLLGFNSCKVLPYKPIIRCNNCQKFGHTGIACRRREVCHFCAKLHKSSSCPVKDDSRRYRCSNCLQTDFDNAHPAFSSECPVFQYHLQQRNSSTNDNRLFSRQ